jgi:hypothetical protein
MQRRADGTLPQQGDVIGGAVLDRAPRLRCPVFGLENALGVERWISRARRIFGRDRAG